MAAIIHDENHYDHAIVGSGCFGSSTALALIRRWPDARIIWFKGTNLHTASKDMTKIIRTPYPDKDYVAFAEKTLKIWETDPLYKEYFHRTGWVQVIGEGSEKVLIEGPSDRMISVEELQNMVGFQDKPKLEDGEKLRFNESVGYADYELAVKAVGKEAIKQGVREVVKEVSRLTVVGGVCQGVEAGDISIVAKKTIVAAGAWTPGLLERSGIPFPSDFFIVSAVGVATMLLEAHEFEELKSMPILMSERGEIILSRQHKALKMTTTSSFRIAHPDNLKDVGYLDVEKNRIVLETLLPQFAGRQLNWWICPDLMTPHQHPLIDQVPGTGQVLVVAGGSYHSAKFLPVVGDMVVRRLCEESSPDTLEGRLLDRWQWDRSTERVPIHRKLIPNDK